MKTRIIGIIVLVLLVLGSIGCSSPRQGVWYVGDKAYAKDPETGKIMTWEHEQSGRDRFEYFDSKPIFDVHTRGNGLPPEIYMNLN